jgi:hypothetical protein
MNDPSATDPGYPVIEEWPLSPVPRRMLRTARRDPSELPRPQPGVSLVFYAEQRKIAYPEHQQIDYANEVVVDAISVRVVDIRARRLTVPLWLRSKTAVGEFAVHVIFGCQVDQVEVAADYSGIDLVGDLRDYVLSDGDLLKTGAHFAVTDALEARDAIETQIEARCELTPYVLPGVRIDFRRAQVLTPEDLAAHEGRKVDILRTHEITRLETEGAFDHKEFSTTRSRDITRFESESAAEQRRREAIAEGRIAEIRRANEAAEIRHLLEVIRDSPDGLTAAAIARGHMNMTDAVLNAREDETQLRASLSRAYEVLHERGEADLMPTELVTRILEAHIAQLTGGRVTTAPIASTDDHPALDTPLTEGEDLSSNDDDVD